VFAKQLTFVLARASGDPFAQIRLIKIVVPLRRLHAKDFKWKPETQPTRATQNGRLGHKVAKQWKKANTKNGCKKKKKKLRKKGTLKVGESLLAVKSRQRALWFSRNMTHITVFN